MLENSNYTIDVLTEDKVKAHNEKPSKRDKTSFDFDRVFVRYAVAGSAVIGLPLLAPAQTLTPTTISTVAGPTTVAVSFDGGPTDFTLGVSYDQQLGSASVYAYGPQTTSFLGPLPDPPFPGYPTAFTSSGAVFDDAFGTSASSGTLLKAAGNQSYSGNWYSAQNQTAYLGVLFQDNGVQYLGWADIMAQATVPQVPTAQELSVPAEPSASATIESIGYEQVAPEPASIALLALGAAGLALLRKRRNTTN